MSNVKFLRSDPGFVSFAEVAMAAENGGVAIQQSLDRLERLKNP